MDETYIKVRGPWKSLYRAVDKYGNTIDFLLSAQRDTSAARCFFEKAIDQNGLPEKVTIEGKASNLAALSEVNTGRKMSIPIRKTKYLNNIVE